MPSTSVYALRVEQFVGGRFAVFLAAGGVCLPVLERATAVS